MNDIKLRPATEEDVSGIVQLWVEAVEFAVEIDSYFTRSSDSEKNFGEFVTGHIHLETASVVVAEIDQSVVGYCLAVCLQRPPLVTEMDYGVIYDLAVTANYRNRGVGSRLCEEVQSWFAGRGIKRIELNVLNANENGRRFWQKTGFQPYMEQMYKVL